MILILNVLPSPDSSGNLPILENKALAVAFLNRELGTDSGKQLLKIIIFT